MNQYLHHQSNPANTSAKPKWRPLMSRSPTNSPTAFTFFYHSTTANPSVFDRVTIADARRSPVLPTNEKQDPLTPCQGNDKETHVWTLAARRTGKDLYIYICIFLLILYQSLLYVKCVNDLRVHSYF